MPGFQDWSPTSSLMRNRVTSWRAASLTLHLEKIIYENNIYKLFICISCKGELHKKIISCFLPSNILSNYEPTNIRTGAGAASSCGSALFCVKMKCLP
jgi:hypothetical protein